jgi:phosphoribosylformimino-5-aminoimidazole carboxamide ribotide isomerase
MIVIPVLEIKNGACAGVADDDAFRGASLAGGVEVAQAWNAIGFSRLHIVDTDAISGIGSNGPILEDVCRDSGMEVQANGGVQTSDGIQRRLEAGAARVVVGTRGIADADWLGSIAESNPGRVILETALKERRIVVRGWVRNLPIDIFDIVEDLHGLPLAGLLVSSSQSDGPRTVIELNLLEDIAEACAFPVLAMGSISSLSDLRALEHRGISAAVMSANLFTGDVDARWVAREFGE